MSQNKRNKGRGGIIIAIIFLAAVIIAGETDLLGSVSRNLRSEFSNVFTQNTGDITVLIAKVLAALGAIALVYLICKLLVFLLQKIGKSARMRTVNELLGSIITYAGIVIGIVWALTILGLNPTAAVASLGIVTLIVGFAAQRLIEDVISGLFIVIEGQYNVGDIIILDDFRGVVRRIGVRTTTIEDPGGNLKVVNNSDIRNFQNRSKIVSLAVSDISITYEADIPEVEAVILEALPGMFERNKDVFLSEPIYKGVEELADSAVVLRFTVETDEENVFVARRRLNRELRVLFAEKGIEIPFPQLTVHKGE